MSDEKMKTTSDKSVSELIFDKFDKLVKDDAFFAGISEELSKSVRKDKRKKNEIADVLKKVAVEKK